MELSKSFAIAAAAALVLIALGTPSGSAVVSTQLPAKVRSMSTDYTAQCNVRVDNSVACAEYISSFDGEKNVRDVSVAWGNSCVVYLNRNVACLYSSTYTTLTGRNAGDATGISVGHYHRCILLTNYNVECQGTGARAGAASNYYGGDAKAVAVGDEHTCVLRYNGNVDCYGSNVAGKANDYLGGDAVALDAGWNVTCIVRANGNGLCQGQDAPAAYTGGNAIGVGVARGVACWVLRTGNVECSNLAYPDYLGGDAVFAEAGILHYCVLTRSGNTICPAQDPFLAGMPSVWVDPTVSDNGNGAVVCDDWNGDGMCNPDESLLVGPREITISGPTGATLGPDRDGDGIASSASVGQGSITINLASQTIEQDPTSSTTVPVDPDDNNANQPGGVRGASAGVDFGCAQDHVCVRASVLAGAAGTDASQSPATSIDAGAPGDAVEDATGHRPYTIAGNSLVVHGLGGIVLVTQPMLVPIPGETLTVGAAEIDLGCDGPGGVTTPSLILGGFVTTQLPSQSRGEPSGVTGPRCLAMNALSTGLVVPLVDVQL